MQPEGMLSVELVHELSIHVVVCWRPWPAELKHKQALVRSNWWVVALVRGSSESSAGLQNPI
jgi:hypothetical protein